MLVHTLARALCCAALALALTPTTAAPAAACGHAMRLETDQESRLLVRAERLIDGDDPRAGLQLLRPFFTPARDRATSSPSAERRAAVLAATAVARLDGRFNRRAALHKTEKERAANLRWAVDTLRTALGRAPDDPALRMALGEALARRQGGEREALQLLGALRDDDLMVSAHGFAALARLEAARGDQAAATASHERCAAMAGDAARGVCGAPATPI